MYKKIKINITFHHNDMLEILDIKIKEAIKGLNKNYNRYAGALELLIPTRKKLLQDLNKECVCLYCGKRIVKKNHIANYCDQKCQRAYYNNKGKK